MIEQCSPHGWTLDTLEKYLSEKIDKFVRIEAERHNADEKALNVAMASLDKRLHSMNEFRQALEDARDEDQKNNREVGEKYLLKNVYEVQHKMLLDLVNINNNRIIDLEKKSYAANTIDVTKKETISQSYMITIMTVSVVSFLTSIVTIVWNFFHSFPILPHP